MQWYSFYSSLQDPTPKPRLQYSVSNRGGMVDSNGYFRPYKWGTFWVKLTGTYNFETKSDSVRIIVQPGTQTLFHTLVPDIFLNSQSKVALKSFLDSKRKPVYEVVQGLASIQNDSLKALQTGTIVLKISHPGDSLFGPSNIVFDTIQVINLGNPNRLRVETPKDTIEAYGALALRATLLDNAQNSVPFDTIQWNVLTKGWITAQGVLTADTFLGVQRFEAVATKNNRLFRDTFEIFVRRPLEILSVDLTNSTSILLPEEICGAIPAKFWFSSTLGSGINLRNNKGVFTRSRFVSNFSSAYTTQDPSNTPNQKMMRIFLGSQSTSSILTLSVRNLPTSFKTNPYDVLVYWGNNENTAKTVAYKVNQGSEMFIRDANNTWKGTFTPSLATVAADAQNDQEYAHFKQVRDTGFTLSARMVNNVQRWGISGFQLVTESIEWGNREQIITFENISNQMIFPGKTLKLKAFASSGLPVSYALISGAAQISGDVLTFQGSAGSVKIMATQNGNNTFVSANPVEVTFQTFVVTQETKVDQESIFNFYPNPAKNELNISAATGAVVYILDLQGKLLMEASITSPYQTIPVEQLTAGTYLLKVKDLSGKVSHYKWIKE